jgi:hypothetical protein
VILFLQGPYRTGKSFLLNQLLRLLVTDVALAEQLRAFTVGNTVQPETEDVSVFIIPACASPIKGTTLLLLDSPGLFSLNRLPVFDAQILAVLNLMSNVVLFNSLSMLDRSSVERLSDAIEAAKTLAYFNSNNSTASVEVLRPHLLFVLQSFRLQLKDVHGEAITPKQWLEQLFVTIDAAHNGTSSYVEQYSRFFNSFDAVPLPFPLPSLDDSQDLDNMQFSAFTAAYQQKMLELSQRIVSLCGQHKLVGDLSMNGPLFARMLRKWVDTVNAPEGSTMSTSDDLMKQLTASEVDRALKAYEISMEALQLPVLVSELNMAHEAALAAVMFHDLPSFRAIVRQAASERYNTFVGMNEQVRRLLCVFQFA